MVLNLMSGKYCNFLFFWSCALRFLEMKRLVLKRTNLASVMRYLCLNGCPTTCPQTTWKSLHISTFFWYPARRFGGEIKLRECTGIQLAFKIFTIVLSKSDVTVRMSWDSHTKIIGGARDCHNHQSIEHFPLKTMRGLRSCHISFRRVGHTIVTF